MACHNSQLLKRTAENRCSLRNGMDTVKKKGMATTREQKKVRRQKEKTVYDRILLPDNFTPLFPVAGILLPRGNL
jgi:hypothetical protein